MKRITLFSLLTVLVLAQSVSARGGQQIKSSKSFDDWCSQKASLSREAAKTVDAVLAEIGTEDCQIAGSSAVSLKELRLSADIRDLAPLESLVGLTRLNLEGNQIEDISPLAKLIRLQRLNLRANKISDLDPLSGLASLKVLQLDKNKISDISSVAKLTGIEQLDLDENNITNLSPLFDLDKLYSLGFSGNSIKENKVRGLGDLLIKDSLVVKLRENKSDDCDPKQICLVLEREEELNRSLKQALSDLSKQQLAKPTANNNFNLLSLLSIMGVSTTILTIAIKVLSAKTSKKRTQERKSMIFREAFNRTSYLKEDWLTLGRTLHRIGLYEEAIEVFDDCIAENPSNAEAWEGRGSALSNVLRADEAILAHQAALAIRLLEETKEPNEDVEITEKFKKSTTKELIFPF